MQPSTPTHATALLDARPLDATSLETTPLATPVIRQLGLRLDHLYQWIIAASPPDGYSDIWDLCCDHGRLGLHLHQSSVLATCHIHLVDRVPSIINQLQHRYHALKDHRLDFMLADAGDIEFAAQGPQAIIVAGVGGETLVRILQGLVTAGLPHQKSGAGFTDFFLSPNSHAYELRHFLIAHGFTLIKEEFISENGYHHEHLHLRHGSEQPPTTSVIALTPAGAGVWQPLTAVKIKHLKKLLKHHQLCYQFKASRFDLEATTAYKKILTPAN